jgi:hypothetical protein
MWVNALTVLAGVGTSDYVQVIPQKYLPYILMASAAANGILRYMPSQQKQDLHVVAPTEAAQ